MYHVECMDIHKNDPLFEHLDRACLCANNMRNVANFYIRNLMTGLKKDPSVRTPNETYVIKTVEGSIPGINEDLRQKYERKVRRVMGNKNLTGEERKKKAAKIRCAVFTAPTADKWFASYGLLDAVFKYTDNTDYRAFHSHVVQNAIKDCVESWAAYFKSLRAYKEGAGPGGMPKIPGYRKSGGRSTAVFSNAACTISKGVLFFPKSVGRDGEPYRCSIPVSALPRASRDKLVEVRAVPYYGGFQLQLVTDDGVKEKDILPPEDGIIGKDGTPSAVMTIDPGLDNLASIADNTGHTPVVIKGGAVKARNQWFNRRMSFLKGEQMRGHDPETYHSETTKQMKALSRKRDAFLRDIFYKYAHYI